MHPVPKNSCSEVVPINSRDGSQSGGSYAFKKRFLYIQKVVRVIQMVRMNSESGFYIFGSWFGSWFLYIRVVVRVIQMVRMNSESSSYIFGWWFGSSKWFV